MALGIVVGASGSSMGFALVDALRPIGTLWVNAIRMTVIPLVVSLLITGVTSVTNMQAVGRLGRRTVVVFAALLIASAVVSLTVGSLLFAAFPWDAHATISLPAGASEAAREITATGPPPGV